MTNERELKPWRNEPRACVYLDREGWPPGPWDDEPDRLEFEHAGLPCLIVRIPLGTWCGYVGVSPDHPWHGRGYDHVDAEAHGGLTFSGACQIGGLICHESKASRADDVWWLGFDCAHAGDLIPGHLKFVGLPHDWDTYRDQSYVMTCVRYLAEQARTATTA